jgi:hypothetical protein
MINIKSPQQILRGVAGDVRGITTAPPAYAAISNITVIIDR